MNDTKKPTAEEKQQNDSVLTDDSLGSVSGGAAQIIDSKPRGVIDGASQIIDSEPCSAYHPAPNRFR